MRMARDLYYMQMAELTKERATCNRLKVGCVIVKDRRVISMGYNGSAPGQDHCIDSQCLVVKNHCKRAIHAELNAILSAAINGVSPLGSTVYVTAKPCFECLKLLVSCKVDLIVYINSYKNGKQDFPYEYQRMSEKVKWQVIDFVDRPSQEEDFQEGDTVYSDMNSKYGTKKHTRFVDRSLGDFLGYVNNKIAYTYHEETTPEGND